MGVRNIRMVNFGLFLLLLLPGICGQDMMDIVIQPDEQYIKLGPVVSSPAVFSVKACYGLRLVFSSSPTFRDTDPNVTISVTQEGSYFSSITTPWSFARVQGLHLDCKKHKTFWVSWGDGVIRVGYGSDVGKNPYLMGSGTDPISYLWLSSETMAELHLDVQMLLPDEQTSRPDEQNPGPDEQTSRAE